jgi:lipopolysaccharide biosynthesis protein
MNFLEQITYNMTAGQKFEGPEEFTSLKPTVRLIAFYLPQFHPIPENDEWWGKGFTEWTNVSKALPRFVGHYQPHLPGELGFYDLRLPDALRAQAALARRHGVYGFCFHYYWFAGRKLLDTPLNILLSNPDIDLPFCINWANQQWTANWHGQAIKSSQESNILIKQEFSEEDDLAFAKALGSIVRDSRYIHIDGRPLVMLYQPSLLPDAAATVVRWREQLKSMGIKNPYVVMPQAFKIEDPRTYGMDAAIGFPPHKWWDSWRDLPTLNSSVHLLDDRYNGTIFSYETMAQAMAELDPKDYKLFPGVCPNWDNEARRPNTGICFIGSTPRIYGRWLTEACRKALRQQHPDERLVFINAWNEWAEGAYLEPDRHYGYAYLNETARALSNLSVTALSQQADKVLAPSRSNHSRTASTASAITHWSRRLAIKGAKAAERLAKILRSI